jgi:hypothetical protein
MYHVHAHVQSHFHQHILFAFNVKHDCLDRKLQALENCAGAPRLGQGHGLSSARPHGSGFLSK